MPASRLSVTRLELLTEELQYGSLKITVPQFDNRHVYIVSGWFNIVCDRDGKRMVGMQSVRHSNGATPFANFSNVVRFTPQEVPEHRRTPQVARVRVP